MKISVIKLSKDGFGFVDMENLCDQNEIRCCDVECGFNINCDKCLLNKTKSGLSYGLDINKFEIKTLNFR